MADEKINPLSEFLFTQAAIDAVTQPRIMFQRIQKRDGTIVDFDKSKIGKAIFSAAQAVGGKDRDMAENLADRVILYLARTHEDGLLNVEQIQDAVEKVLIENGHARTVKAYILYRDQRARIRKVQSGNVQLKSQFPVITPLPEVRVQTSEDELIGWNKERIIEALVREARLEKEIAQVIASEVEQQIVYSKMQVVTVGLIRELVNAKLIEYGLIQEHRLHARLGLPVYDLEQLFFPDSIIPTKEPSSPRSLDSTIAKDIYRQYALTRVFSNDVVTAHARGQIHLHDLDSIPRLVNGPVPLANLIKNGLHLPTSQTYWKPASGFSELVTQMIQLGIVWQNYFTESVDWWEFNLHFSGFQINREELDKEIRRFLTELNEFGNSVVHRIHFIFPPQASTPAQEIFSSFLAEYAKGDDIGRDYSNILPVIHISPESTDRERIFNGITEMVNEKRKVEIHFDRQAKSKPVYTIHKVTLNIVEAAAKAKDNVTEFLNQLNEPVKLAIQAHQQKNQFITHLLFTGKNSVLAFLSESLGNSMQEKNRTSRFALGITGLEQAIELLSPSPNMTLEKKMEFTVTVIEKIIALVKQENWKSGLDISLEPTNEKSIAYRLNKLTHVEGNQKNWTPGVEFSNVDSIQLCGRLYSCFGNWGIISVKPTEPLDKYLKEILDCTEVPGILLLS